MLLVKMYDLILLLGTDLLVEIISYLSIFDLAILGCCSKRYRQCTRRYMTVNAISLKTVAQVPIDDILRWSYYNVGSSVRCRLLELPSTGDLVLLVNTQQLIAMMDHWNTCIFKLLPDTSIEQLEYNQLLAALLSYLDNFATNKPKLTILMDVLEEDNELILNEGGMTTVTLLTYQDGTLQDDLLTLTYWDDLSSTAERRELISNICKKVTSINWGMISQYVDEQFIFSELVVRGCYELIHNLSQILTILSSKLDIPADTGLLRFYCPHVKLLKFYPDQAADEGVMANLCSEEPDQYTIIEALIDLLGSTDINLNIMLTQDSLKGEGRRLWTSFHKELQSSLEDVKAIGTFSMIVIGDGPINKCPQGDPLLVIPH